MALAAALSEGGIQVKMFAKSETRGQFHVMDFNFKRSDNSSTKFITDCGEWGTGIIREWRNALPEVILEAIQN